MKTIFKQLLLAIPFSACLSSGIHAQQTAYPFALNDINGAPHNLYQYLDQGKLVVIDFMEAECGPCMGYHVSNALNDLYNHYGPNGTIEPNKVMVLMVDVLQSTSIAGLNGSNGLSYNWVAHTDYPIIDLSPDTYPAHAQIVNSYNAWGTPTIVKICPADNKAYNAGYPTTSWGVASEGCSEQGLLDWFHGPSCMNVGTAGLGDHIDLEMSLDYFPNPSTGTVFMRTTLAGDYQIRVVDLLGQVVYELAMEDFSGETTLDLAQLPTGIYTISTQFENTVSTKKIVIE